MLKRYLDRERREDLRAGTVVAMIANVNRRNGTAAYSAKDFFASLQPPQRKAQSDAEQIAALDAWSRAAI